MVEGEVADLIHGPDNGAVGNDAVRDQSQIRDGQRVSARVTQRAGEGLELLDMQAHRSDLRAQHPIRRVFGVHVLTGPDEAARKGEGVGEGRVLSPRQQDAELPVSDRQDDDVNRRDDVRNKSHQVTS